MGRGGGGGWGEGGERGGGGEGGGGGGGRGGGARQQQAFGLVNKDLSSTMSTSVLALYEPNRPTTMSADAASFGLGTVLLQTSEGVRRPVAFALMTRTEQPYSQIEREALATTWSLERFV